MVLGIIDHPAAKLAIEVIEVYPIEYLPVRDGTAVKASSKRAATKRLMNNPSFRMSARSAPSPTMIGRLAALASRQTCRECAEHVMHVRSMRVNRAAKAYPARVPTPAFPVMPAELPGVNADKQSTGCHLLRFAD